MASRKRLGRWVRVAGMATMLGWGVVSSASAAPTPAQILGFPPRQSGVECTTPNAEQLKDYKVDLIKTRGGSGWLLSGPGGTVRRFTDSNNDNKIDTWAYFKDGVEVYREIDSNSNGKPDQYRWFNTAGSRWGMDANEDSRIDAWKVISQEEVSQELLQAVAAADATRFQALLVTEADLKALELTSEEADRVRASLREARSKFDELSSKLKDAQKVNWLHLETVAPQCRPATEGGPRVELLRHARGTVYYDVGGRSEVLQLGEMLQVGTTWRLTSAPTQGTASAATVANAPASSGNPKLQKAIEELTDLDKTPPSSSGPGPNAAVLEYNLKRADLLERIIAEVPAPERETWIRQVADCLGTGLQSSPETETVAAARMKSLEKQIVEAMPGSNLAAYVTYRRMQAEYGYRLQLPKADYAKLQQEWVDTLGQFVETYAKADDAADAMLQLGMVHEFLSKETDARKWYSRLATDFAGKPQGAKGQGAARRLDCVGKEFQLSANLLDGGKFEVASLRGKLVAVYYWASWNQQSASDFSRLKSLQDLYQSKGLELVCVNLDTKAEEARAAVKRLGAVGRHLHETGGLDSAPATEYGVMVLPHLFLVGTDGKVLSRTVQLMNLEDEVKKLLK